MTRKGERREALAKAMEPPSWMLPGLQAAVAKASTSGAGVDSSGHYPEGRAEILRREEESFLREKESFRRDVSRDRWEELGQKAQAFLEHDVGSEREKEAVRDLLEVSRLGVLGRTREAKDALARVEEHHGGALSSGR